LSVPSTCWPPIRPLLIVSKYVFKDRLWSQVTSGEGPELGNDRG
jgi:hypothetical protein